ncbi:hypothetical protein BKA56DRAFT_475534 [Ilyonectria sp. MPI-CAGE-AT-0026]|nr:hypothetical protein BKA56DRAFT_475534 [Ilyonectria sp. MPI-CAGE-AT-0026]
MPTSRISDGMRRRCIMACENCKRRKERCDGNLPCRRCVSRRVQAQCQYSKHRGTFFSHENAGTRPRQSLTLQDPLGFLDDAVWTPTHLSTAVPSVCRLVRDGQGGSVFLGDSANESFLQQIRQLVAQNLGSCPFVDEPVQFHIVDDTSTSLVRWDETPAPPTKPSPAQANYFVSWSMRATSCLLGVVRESEAQKEIAQWLEQRDENASLSTALYYLIIANGALSCPEDEDHIADACFSYARYLTHLKSMDEPNLKSILCYAWIAFYQLGTGRRNAAYYSVGIAVRAACAMGIHRADLPCSLSVDNLAFRERLWKALRKLDIFTSASLGRPICTNETRDTKAEQGYSSTIDITAMLEAILREVYPTFKVSRNFVVSMTKEHRLWATRIVDGLKADGIEPVGPIEGFERQPNLAFSNMKESYYWSIMLLTRPFLLERASTQTPQAGLRKVHPGGQDELPQVSHTDTALVYACVDSAVRTIDLLQYLLFRADLPKRLPFAVNSAFGAALTLGVAIFADLDRVFPLQKKLQTTERLLQKFRNHDPVAKYYRIVVEQLQSTCDRYVERRNRYVMESQGQLVGDLFGRVHEDFLSSNETFDEMNDLWADALARTQLPLPQSPMSSLPTVFLADELPLGLESVNSSGSLLYPSLDPFQRPHLIDMDYVDSLSCEEHDVF